MKLKTHKAFTKRFKITGSGKLMKRYAGQNHFNSRDSGTVTRKKRRDVEFSHAHRKAVKVLMPHQ